MTGPIVSVGFQYVYDLYYRTRNALLEYEVYQLDFLEWVKAGVAFNVLGAKNPERSVAYFGALYCAIIGRGQPVTEDALRDAVVRYYEDIFQLYQDHLKAQLKVRARKTMGKELTPKDLIILPSFSQPPGLFTSLPFKQVDLEDYVTDDLKGLRQKMATIYAREDSSLFHAMSLMYDYGYRALENGIILEVR